MSKAICTRHDEELIFIGQMSEADDGLACPFCMNDLDKECLHAHEGGCKGAIAVVFGVSGLPMAMCDAHELRMYQRQDNIAANYR